MPTHHERIKSSSSPDLVSPRHSNGSSSSSASIEALERSEYVPIGQRPRHHRSNTINSVAAFQFEADMLPLSLSEPGGESEQASEKTVGYLSG